MSDTIGAPSGREERKTPRNWRTLVALGVIVALFAFLLASGVRLQTAGITDRQQTVMVGDREHDVKGAARNGLPCIGAVYGYGSAEELTGAGAVALADSVQELHPLLLEN